MKISKLDVLLDLLNRIKYEVSCYGLEDENIVTIDTFDDSISITFTKESIYLFNTIETSGKFNDCEFIKDRHRLVILKEIY